MQGWWSQGGSDIRLEWGQNGLSGLAPAEVVVVVDVLSFCTAAAVACERGAVVLPFSSKDEAAASAYASERGAVLAGSRGGASGFSLSPASLAQIPMGLRLVLPSPNGSALCHAAGGRSGHVLAACLRNAADSACLAAQLGSSVAVIAAGERWEDGSLRPALEDLIGAGAVIHGLPGVKSPEAQAAEAVFLDSLPRLGEVLRTCASGRELIERGFAADVELAAQIDAGGVPCLLLGGALAAP